MLDNNLRQKIDNKNNFVLSQNIDKVIIKVKSGLGSH